MKKRFSIFMALIISTGLGGSMMYAQNAIDPGMTADQAKKSVDVLLSLYNDLMIQNTTLKQQLDDANAQNVALSNALKTSQAIVNDAVSLLKAIKDTILVPLGNLLGSLGDPKALSDQIDSIQGRANDAMPSNNYGAKKIVVNPNSGKGKDSDKKNNGSTTPTPAPCNPCK